MATVDDKKIIFSMVGVSKIIPQNQKQILKDIYLSFFYGAKIGIIGLNGAGKSTLMKIIAGLVEPTKGEVVWSPGYSVGYLPQDPPLNEEKTVKENIQEGVQQIYDTLKEYDEINVKFGLEEYYSDAVIFENDMGIINQNIVSLLTAINSISDAIHGISQATEEASIGVTQIANKTSDMAADTGKNVALTTQSKEATLLLKEVVDILK